MLTITWGVDDVTEGTQSASDVEAAIQFVVAMLSLSPAEESVLRTPDGGQYNYQFTDETGTNWVRIAPLDAKDFVRASTPDGAGLDGIDLAADAARAAAHVLAENWQDAVRDGEHPSKLFKDIDDCIFMLGEWRKALQHNWPAKWQLLPPKAVG